VVATANNLRGVAYSSADEVFCVVGNGDEFWRSFDGINWTGGFNQDLVDSATYDRGDENARIEYSAITDEFIWCYHKNNTITGGISNYYYNLVSTSDLGVTFMNLGSSLGMLPRGNKEHNIKSYYISCRHGYLRHSEEGNVYTFPNSTHPHIVRHNFINETWLAVDERGVGAKSSEANGDSGWTASTTNPWATLDVCNNVINSV
ncbi:MAG: hypothetical protein GY814_18745, partial [Gammaproteobacteria bacterium]|nr:hypothetical protein [Gammaproteobacteria bacterium]